MAKNENIYLEYNILIHYNQYYNIWQQKERARMTETELCIMIAGFLQSWALKPFLAPMRHWRELKEVAHIAVGLE